MPSLLHLLPLLLLSLVLANDAFCHTPILTSPKTNTASNRTFTLTGFIDPSSCVESATPPANWAYRGCFTENGTTRAVPGGSYVSQTNMTRARCIAIAGQNGHSWAALVYGRECFTGTSLNPGSNATADSECGTTCLGSTTGEKCGANRRASVLQLSGPSSTLPTLLLKTTESGQLSRLTPNATGHISVELKKQPLGTQYFYLVQDGDAAETLRSNVAAVMVQCSKPVIGQPNTADWLPTYNEYDDVVLHSSRPTIAGTSDCPMVTIELSGRAPYTLAVNDGGFFNTESKQLANGRYVLTVLASDANGAYSARSNQRNIVVDSSDPRATGDLSRRALRRQICRKNEQACPFVAVGRKRGPQFRCYPDLSSNLERCGSCTGPDCSAIPNVGEVSCRKGRCEVHSCTSGYSLVGNACVAGSAERMVISRLRRRK